MHTEQELNRVIDLYADTVKRLCILHLHNASDTDDVFQTVFLKYLQHTGNFENAEHEKAWILRVTINACKDLQRSFFRTKTVPLEEALQQAAPEKEQHHEVLEAVCALPTKYKQVVYLHFYEDLSVPQIANILHKNENTVYTHLKRAKALLKKKLGGIANG